MCERLRISPPHTSPRRRRFIPKAELRKIKCQVAALRKKGHEVWTDDEVERAGYTLDILAPSVSLAVPKQMQEADWDCGLACAKMALLTLGCPASDCGIKSLRSRLVSSEVCVGRVEKDDCVGH